MQETGDIKRNSRQYSLKNKKKIALVEKQWRQNNKEKRNATTKRYKEKHKKQISLYNSKYAKENPGIMNAKTMKRTAMKLKATQNGLQKNISKK